MRNINIVIAHGYEIRKLAFDFLFKNWIICHFGLSKWGLCAVSPKIYNILNNFSNFIAKLFVF